MPSWIVRAFQSLTKLSQSAAEQAGDGCGGAAGFVGDLLQRAITQMLKDDNFTLIHRKLHQSKRQSPEVTSIRNEQLTDLSGRM
jgi:hypothetical protein